MAIRVGIEINRAFDVCSDFERVFTLLADVPASAGFFPKLDKLEALGNNAYRWEIEKIGIDKYSIQTIYASRYKVGKKGDEISWTPVPGEGNGLVSGRWQIQAKGPKATQLVFSTQAELNLALPGFLKLAVSPVVKHEFNNLVDQYIRNLQNHFSGV